MCYAKPGPRCSACTRKKLNRLLKWKQRNPDAPNIDEKIRVAQEAYWGTKKGIKELREAGETDKADEYQKEYDAAIEAYKKLNGGVTTPVSQRKESKTVKTSLGEPASKESSLEEKEKAAREKVEKLREEYHNLMGNVDEKVTPFDTPLTDNERKANAILLAIGEEVNTLAEAYGKPTVADVEELKAKAEEKKSKADALYQKAKELKREMYGKIDEQYDTMDNLDRMKYMSETRAKINEYSELIRKEEDSIEPELLLPFAEKQRNAYMKALETVGVEFVSPEDLTDRIKPFKNTPNNRRLIPTVADAAKYYPKSWLKGVEESGATLSVQETKTRASFLHNGGASVIHATRSEPETVAHELGHFMESTNPFIGEAERVFIQNEQEEKNQSFTRKGSGRSAERYATQTLVTDYSARVYNQYRGENKYSTGKQVGENYEVLTTGVETVFFAQYGGGFGETGKFHRGKLEYRESPQHIKFVLGILSLKK